MAIRGVKAERSRNVPFGGANFFMRIGIVVVAIFHKLPESIEKDCRPAKKGSLFHYAAIKIEFAN